MLYEHQLTIFPKDSFDVFPANERLVKNYVKPLQKQGINHTVDQLIVVIHMNKTKLTGRIHHQTKVVFTDALERTI